MRRLLAVALVVVLLVGTAPVASVQRVSTAQSTDALHQTPDEADASVRPVEHIEISSQTVSDTAKRIDTSSPSVSEIDANPRSVDEIGANPQTLGATDNFDSVEFHITVYENGTAEWTFTYQRTLNNDTERQQFEQFASEFNNNSTEMWRNFKKQARRLASAGQNFTGRAMMAQNFRKRAYVGGIVNDNRGIVKMSFQWTGFAYAEGQTVIIGDVFDGGLYISPNQSLVIHSGPGLHFASVNPKKPAKMSGDSLATSESVTWEGEHDFNDQRPRVKFEPVKATTTTTTTQRNKTTVGTNGTGPTQTTPANASQPPAGDGSGWSPLMIFIGAVVVLLGLAAAFAWRQGDFGSLAGDGNTPSGGDASGGATASTDQNSPEPSVSDEELLTDEARVKKLLDENGGRMKQVNIVDETGWSKSKVSMLLSEMEEDGEISKLRVGRENIISLEGHEPDAAGSPLEGE